MSDFQNNSTTIESADLVTTTDTGDLDMQAEAGPNSAPPELMVSDTINDEAVRKAISEYLTSEITDVRDGNDRKGLEERWQNFRRIRRARTESETRTSPWKNSANLMPPLTAQKVNTIYAKEISAFATKKPPVQVEAMNRSDSEKAESLSRFFEGIANSTNGLNMKKNQQVMFYEQVSMGTQFVKVPFLVDKWAFKRVGQNGEEQVTYVRHQGPAIQPIRLEDFFTRPYWKDLQRAPWIAVRYRYYQHELLQQGAIGAFNAEVVQRILNQNITEYDDNQMASLIDAKVSVGDIGKVDTNKEYEIYECYVFWDVDNDGIPEDVKFWIEANSGEILRTEYNPLSMRDIEPVIYFDDPDVLYGVGVCELTEKLQEEVTTLHNMRFDGTQLAMLKVWFARRGTGIADTEFSPFKVLELDDPRNDINAIDFPDVAPSCITGEMIAREYADKVTGASDYMAGFNDKTVGSGATLGGTTFLAQQSNTILSSIFQNAEISMTNIFTIAFYQCVAHKDQVDLSFLSENDRVNVMEILSMNVEDIPTKFRFIVKSTELDKTEEARKQSYLAGSQMYAQYGQKMVELQQTIMMATQGMPQQGIPPNPQLAELATKLYVGSTEFMRKTFEAFDLGDPDTYFPFIEDTKFALKQQDEAKRAALMQQKGAMNNAEGLTGAGGQTGEAIPSPAGMAPANAGMGLGSATSVPNNSGGPQAVMPPPA